MLINNSYLNLEFTLKTACRELSCGVLLKPLLVERDSVLLTQKFKYKLNITLLNSCQTNCNPGRLKTKCKLNVAVKSRKLNLHYSSFSVILDKIKFGIFTRTEASLKRATKTCNLFFDIAAKEVEKRCCPFYHPRIKLDW